MASELIDRRDKNVLNNNIFFIHAFFKPLVSQAFFIFKACFTVAAF